MANAIPQRISCIGGQLSQGCQRGRDLGGYHSITSYVLRVKYEIMFIFFILAVLTLILLQSWDYVALRLQLDMYAAKVF